MLFSALKTAFLSLSDDPATTNAQAGIWINANYATLCRERDWPFMVGNGSYTVTSGTAEKAFSAFSTPISDFAKPLRVWIASSSTADKSIIKPINYEERNVAGLDGCYYVTPNNLSIGLVATPTNSTNVVTMDYLKTTTDMDDAVETSPAFLADFHWILVFKALMNYQYQQRESSEEFRQQYEDILEKMVRFYFNPQAATTVRLDRGAARSGRDSSSPFRY